MTEPEVARAVDRADLDTVRERETAFHEAGHVVVERAFGGSPDLVFMNDDRSAGELVAAQTQTRSFLVAQMFPHGGAERETRLIADAAMMRAAALFAGPVAATIASGHHVDLGESICEVLMSGEEDHGTDQHKLADLIAGLDSDTGEVFLEHAAELALMTLTEQWSDVERSSLVR